jgi:hypothetical protein
MSKRKAGEATPAPVSQRARVETHGPLLRTTVHTSADGRFVTETTTAENDKLHRLDGPASQQWQVEQGQRFLIAEEWFIDDKPHRLDGPSRQLWRVVQDQRLLVEEEWFIDGKLHRPDGPSRQLWRVEQDQQLLVYEEWFIDHKRHRLDGPARQRWQVVQGQRLLLYSQWFIHDKEYALSQLNAWAKLIQARWRWWHGSSWRRARQVRMAVESADGSGSSWRDLARLIGAY